MPVRTTTHQTVVSRIHAQINHVLEIVPRDNTETHVWVQIPVRALLVRTNLPVRFTHLTEVLPIRAPTYPVMSMRVVPERT